MDRLVEGVGDLLHLAGDLVSEYGEEPHEAKAKAAVKAAMACSRQQFIAGLLGVFDSVDPERVGLAMRLDLMDALQANADKAATYRWHHSGVLDRILDGTLDRMLDRIMNLILD